MENVIDKFIKYLKTDKYLINHILNFEPNTIFMYISGSSNLKFTNAYSDINITCVVYKYPKFTRLPECYYFNNVRVNINCISIDYFLEYNNIYEPFMVEVASEENAVEHFNMIEFLLFKYVDTSSVIYVNDKFKPLYEFVYSKKDDFVKISLDNLMYMKNERILDILNNTNLYSKYKYIYIMLYAADHLIFTDNIKDDDFYINIKNSETYKDIGEYDTFIDSVKRMKDYFDTNILELELRNTIKQEFDAIAEKICIDNKIVIYNNTTKTLNLNSMFSEYICDIGQISMFIYKETNTICVLYDRNLRIYLVDSDRYLNTKSYTLYKKYHVFDNGTYRIKEMPWEKPERYQVVRFDDNNNIIERSDIEFYEE